MENKVTQTVQQYHMLSPGDCVVIGLSGGADSCALLRYLVSRREELSLKLIACHVNHLLRGEEAERDQCFAQQLCQSWNIPFRLQRVDVAAIARQRRTGTEETGRELRYAFFESVAQEFDAKIATAHTASDNAETILLNLTRGSGLKGLCGIPPVRGRIIRPLIGVTREETEAYCYENGIAFVTDSTNLTEEYTRNRLRLSVLPVLKEINPSVIRNIIAMSELLRDDEEYLTLISQRALQAAQTPFGYQVKQLYNLSDSVFSRCVRLLLAEYGVVPERIHIRLIRGILLQGGAVEVKKDIFVVSKQGYLRILNTEQRSQEPENIQLPFWGQGGTVVINNRKICIRVMNIDEFHKYQKFGKLLFQNCLDYDKIPLTAVLRTMKAGDRMHPAKRGITKVLRKLFSEAKIPAEQRSGKLLIADGSRILWAESLGQSEDCRITDNTRKVVVLDLQNCGSCGMIGHRL